MRPRKSLRLALEHLEDRCCPANFTLDAAGNLTINTGSSLTQPQTVRIASTAANTFSVQINGIPAMATDRTIVVNGGITVITGAGDDSVLLNLDGTSSLNGNFTVNTGNSGANGDAVTVTTTGGSSILGNVSITNADMVTMNTPSILGNVTINDSLKGAQGISVSLAGAVGGPASLVGGNLTFVGGAGFGSSLTLSGSIKVRGSVSANLGAGFGGGYTDSSSTVVGGNVTVSASGAGETMDLNGQVQGSETFSLGSGLNFLFFSNTAFVRGNFTYTAGNSDPTVGGNTINTFNGTIGGNLYISLGNGLNTIGNTNTDFTPTVLGTSMTIVLGNGTNSTFIGSGTAAPNARLSIIQGNGTNTLNVQSNNFKSGSIIFGKGTNSLTTPPGGFAFPVTVRM